MSRPVSSNSKKNRTRREEYGKEKMLDKLATFEELDATVLPMLMKLLVGNATPEQMRNELAPYLEARKLSIALTSKDEGKVLQAIQDAQNRIEGKPKERTEHTHRFENVPDKELDAIISSELESIEDEETIQ